LHLKAEERELYRWGEDMLRRALLYELGLINSHLEAKVAPGVIA
jgi:hypothetical protein